MLKPAAGRLVAAVENKSPRQDTVISGTISESGTVGLTGHSFTKYSKVMDNGMFTYFVVSDQQADVVGLPGVVSVSNLHELVGGMVH